MKKCLLAICLFYLFGMLQAQDAQENFLKGQELLKQSNFEEALKCFEKAWKLDKSKESYKREYMLLRQVIKVRQYLPKESNQEKWASMAYSLYTYYTQCKAYDEMIAIAKEIHEKVSNDDSFLLVAETYILTQKNKEAIQWISPAKPLSPFLNILYAIALARTGEIEESKKIYGELAKKDQKNVFYIFYKASLESLIGYKETALKTLAVCFKYTPSAQLGLLQERAMEFPDFKALHQDQAFKEVMKIRSMVPESSCSEGKDCSTCPSRSKCGGQ